jgi:hypothetical protein
MGQLIEQRAENGFQLRGYLTRPPAGKGPASSCSSRCLARTASSSVSATRFAEEVMS